MIVTDSTTWERAAIRAAARGIEAHWIKMAGQGHNVKEYWRTNSTSNPDANHYVMLEYTADGVSAVCDCQGAQRELPCVHASAALQASQAMLDEAWSDAPQLEVASAPVDIADVNQILFGDLAAD